MKKYYEWTKIPWDGNTSLGLYCWRLSWGLRGNVSVGIGPFLNIAFSYGPDNDNSCGGTRWNYGAPVITEEQAMTTINGTSGKHIPNMWDDFHPANVDSSRWDYTHLELVAICAENGNHGMKQP
jgi:hypothetical protein